MAVIGPLTPPPYPAPVTSDFQLAQAIVVDRNDFTFSEISYRWPGEQWLVSLNLPRMKGLLADLWSAFLLSCDGPVNAFWLGDPDRPAPRGVGVNAAPLVNGANQTGEDIVLDNLPLGTANILAIGDYLQLGNYLFRLVKPLNSDGSGVATATVRPRVKYAPADNDPVTVRNPRGLFKLASTDQGRWTSDALKVYGLSLQARSVT